MNKNNLSSLRPNNILWTSGLTSGVKSESMLSIFTAKFHKLDLKLNFLLHINHNCVKRIPIVIISMMIHTDSFSCLHEDI